jgi:hypothetical protein
MQGCHNHTPLHTAANSSIEPRRCLQDCHGRSTGIAKKLPPTCKSMLPRSNWKSAGSTHRMRGLWRTPAGKLLQCHDMTGMRPGIVIGPSSYWSKRGMTAGSWDAARLGRCRKGDAVPGRTGRCCWLRAAPRALQRVHGGLAPSLRTDGNTYVPAANIIDVN